MLIKVHLTLVYVFITSSCTFLSFLEHYFVYENNIHNCQYYDEDEINKKFNSILTEQFSILSLNIQSLPGKFNEFQTFFASTMGKFKPSVIAL